MIHPFKNCLIALAVGLANMPGDVFAGRELAAHAHGEARLDIAADGGVLHIALISPSANLIGFETRPESEEEQARLDSTLHNLRDPASNFLFTEGEACTLTDGESSWQSAHDDPSEKHGHEHAEVDAGSSHNDHDSEGNDDEHSDNVVDGHTRGTHSEIVAEWVFQCEGDTLPTAITLSLFDHYPAIHKVIVQGAVPNGQVGATLTPDRPSITLP